MEYGAKENHTKLQNEKKGNRDFRYVALLAILFLLSHVGALKLTVLSSFRLEH